MRRATLADGTQIEYVYDAAGRKVGAVTTKGTATRVTSYVVAAGRVLEAYEDG